MNPYAKHFLTEEDWKKNKFYGKQVDLDDVLKIVPENRK